MPGPYICSRLEKLGATILKVEPPAGDPLEKYSLSYYRELLGEQKVVRWNLKDEVGLSKLKKEFKRRDLWISASRKNSLERLGLQWSKVHRDFPKLSQLAIESHGTETNWPGHDLNFQASKGFVTPPHLPVSLFADLAGALEGLIKVLSGYKQGTYYSVALSEGLAPFEASLRHGLTGNSETLLGGKAPEYGVYKAQKGWVAVALLEPHLARQFQELLGLKNMTRKSLASEFLKKTDVQWSTFGKKNSLPINKVNSR